MERPLPYGKIKHAEYKKGYFRVGRSTIDLITYKDEIVIPQKTKKYVVKWHHTYLLHPELDRTEEIIFQHLYLPGIKYAVYREVTFCDTCQCTKRSIIKYGELTAKLAEETPRNKLCVDLTCPYKMRRKGKEPSILK